MMEDIGTREYLVLMYCAAFTGKDQPNTGPSSGLFAFQTSFSLLGLGLNLGWTGAEKTQVDVYGTNMSDIALHGTCWSGNILFEALIPRANVIGDYYEGSLPLGSFVSDTGAQSVFTVQNLISSAGNLKRGQDNIVLSTHVNSTSTLMFGGNTSVQTDFIPSGPFLDETVHYVVVPRMAASITEGGGSQSTRQDYSFVATVKSNWVVYPKFTPASRSLAENSKVSKAKHIDDGLTVNTSKLVALESARGGSSIIPKTPSSGWSISSLFDHFVDNQDSYMDVGKKIFSAVWKILPLILVEGDVDEGKPKVINVSDVWFRLRDIGTLQATTDPRLDAIIDTINQSVLDALAQIDETGLLYVYPEKVYTEPRLVVSAKNVLATWTLLNNPNVVVPEMVSTPDEPFRLIAGDQGWRDWYKDFILQFMYGIAIDRNASFDSNFEFPPSKAGEDHTDTIDDKLDLLMRKEDRLEIAVSSVKKNAGRK